jgi:SAM-dependent methyltransferase
MRMPIEPRRRLDAFYTERAREEPARDPEAILRFERAVRMAEIQAGQRILDLGAKRGRLAAAIGPDVAYVGLDLSSENVEAAQAAGLDVRLGDVGGSLPFGAAEFDRVFCLELLEHVPEPLALLREIRRVLREDGRAVVSVPSPYSWVEVARELLDRHDPEGHLNAYTTPVFRNLAALAGLRVVRRGGTSIRLPKTLVLFGTDSILARSRIFVVTPDDAAPFAGRSLPPE